MKSSIIVLVFASAALGCGVELASSTTEVGSMTDSDGGTEATESSTGDGTETSGGSSSGGSSGGLPNACAEQDARHYCTTDEGTKGVQFCGVIDGLMQWSACVRYIACWPGDKRECDPLVELFDQKCVLDEEGLPMWTEDPEGEECFTPLVLRFDEARPELSRAGSHAFDISGTGACLTTDWPSAATPWLVLDRDGDGGIADAREMFGSAVVLRTGERAANGFAALAELDGDGDRRITPDDAVWPDLMLWSDHDGDRRSTPWELESVSARGIAGIDLEFHLDPRCDARGNCEVEQAAFTWRGAGGRPNTGTVVDLHLTCQ